MNESKPSYEAMLAYRGRLLTFIREFSEYLSVDQIGEIVQLVDHGEPAEALISLAWKLDRIGYAPSSATLVNFHQLAGGLIDLHHLPERYRHSVDASGSDAASR